MDFKKIYERNKDLIHTVLVTIAAIFLLRYIFSSESLEDVEPILSIDEQAEPVVEPVEEVLPVEEQDLSPIPEGQQNGGEIQPADLLPMSQDVVNFTQQFPKGEEMVKDKNFLVAGHNIGINTVASSLKNANLQLRSDPYIPRQDTGPWNQSTIMSSDLTNRKPLEIGTTL